ETGAREDEPQPEMPVAADATNTFVDRRRRQALPARHGEDDVVALELTHPCRLGADVFRNPHRPSCRHTVFIDRAHWNDGGPEPGAVERIGHLLHASRV